MAAKKNQALRLLLQMDAMPDSGGTIDARYNGY
ncbi:hypothetical protein DSUL_100188 [Desulfovibrionales bacterium]